MIRIVSIVGVPVLVAILCGCTQGDAQVASSDGVPGATWAHVSADEAGFDPRRLPLFIAHVGGSGCIVRGGRMVQTWGYYAHPLDVASAVKPVYAHLVLMAVKDELIDDLDDPVCEFVPDLAELNPDLDHKDKDITWRHLLQQTACYGMQEAPGTAFNYSDYQTALMIDTLVHKVRGAIYPNVDEQVLDPSLTVPLQCQDSPTLNSPRSHPGRLRISARDFARFGLLYLHEGQWGDRQVLPRRLAKMAVSSPLTADIPRTQQIVARMRCNQRSVGAGPNQEEHLNSYSYMWWVNGVDDNGRRVLPDAPPDTFLAEGHSGHDALIVVPSLDLVVCWLDAFPFSPAHRFHQDGRRLLNEGMRFLLAALPEYAARRSATPPDAESAP